MGKYRVIHTFHDSESDTTHVSGSFYETSDEKKAQTLANYIHVPATEKVVETISPELEALHVEAKELKVKGYTKMDVEGLTKAIEAVKAKKASE